MFLYYLLPTIQASHLPASHSKLVRVSVDNPELFGSLCLFEPVLGSLHKMGVTMSDALVDVQGVITLLVRNQGTEPVLLERDSVVGCLEPVKVIEATSDQAMEIPVNEEVATATSPKPLVAAVQNTQRMQELLTNLGLEGTDLNPYEKLQLESLVEEFSDLFAMSSSELGCTLVVKHQIKTGDHKSIKQLPRRFPTS